MTLVKPLRVSGGDHEHGHLEEFRVDPLALMRRVRVECGDVGAFDLAGRHVILLSGAEANEFFFRSGDEDLDQAAAYPFMKPIFGEGVVFDASPERRKEMLHNQALRAEQCAGMRRPSRARSSACWRTGATRARSTCSTSSPS